MKAPSRGQKQEVGSKSRTPFIAAAFDVSDSLSTRSLCFRASASGQDSPERGSRYQSTVVSAAEITPMMVTPTVHVDSIVRSEILK